jgi:uncharacterized membrane protein YhaH (DUF805 family)
VKRLIPTAKAPLALAAFLGIPVFFASLMAVSLAIEKPRAVEWTSAGQLIRRLHDPTASNEAHIWLFSLVAPLLLLVAGLLASHIRRAGIYLVCVAAVVDALALTIRLGTWERHHTARYPFGEDNYPDSSTSSLISRGQWEHNAADTVHSLVDYTIWLALAAVAISAFFAWRRSRHGDLPATPPPPDTALSSPF